MNKIKHLCVGLSVLLLFFATFAEKKVCTLKGDYLGQVRPGLTPKVFSPGIISTDGVEHGSLVFSPDGKEVYWSRVSKDFKKGAIWIMKQEKGKWSVPQIVSFSDENSRDLCPAFSADGKRLFFTSQRPVKGQAGYNLWFVSRDKSGWLNPQPLNTAINDGHQSGCCLDKDNRLYFMSWKKGDPKTCDLYVSQIEGGQYTKAVNLGKQINSPEIESTPYISPDNQYLLFCSMNRSDGRGGFDLYVGFKNKDGSWTKAINMGPTINTEKNEWFPSVSPDGKYIFFISNKAGSDDYYWVDSKIIKKFNLK